MRSRSRRRHVQLDLESARRVDGKHGGWRPNAGRKRQSGAISHDTRPAFPASHPQHVTIRLVDGAPNLATDWLMKIVRAVIRESHKADFRIVEFNVLGNHLHLINEAHGPMSLARGMQGFEIRLAKRLNSALKRRGKLFAHRYHARVLRTPTEVRFALRYVLLNRKHHAAEKKFDKYWIDPYSSAPWFRGWAEPIRSNAPWLYLLLKEERPNAAPTVWLLTVGWRQRHGPLRFEDRPASKREHARTAATYERPPSHTLAPTPRPREDSSTAARH